MTGLDALKQAIKEKGIPSPNLETKTVRAILDIFANDGTDKYLKAKELEDEIQRLEREKNWREERIAELKTTAKREMNDYELFEKEYKEAYEYIKKFENSLTQCETAQGRDRMRAAQVFVDTVNIDTKYDNTAFIQGLAALLSGTQFDSGNGIKKINAKLDFPGFNYHEDTGELCKIR